MIHTTTVSTTEELQQVLTLQQKNLISNISDDERQSQGFVTLQHTLDTLQQMHQLAPSVVAKDNDKVVGYALTMLPECRQLVPDLEPMFAILDTLEWKQRPLNNSRFYVMGQICIDKEYRGKGLFDLLYQQHKDTYGPQFDCLVTEIATRNHRSLRAHERVGFEVIHTHRDVLDEWVVVVWDWEDVH